MVHVYFAADKATAAKIATYLDTLHITVFYNRALQLYYVNIVSTKDMHIVAAVLQIYHLIA